MSGTDGIKNTIDTVQVALRIRPLTEDEIKQGFEECIEVVPGEQQVQIKDLTFTYNYVFAQHITQQEFYDTAVKGVIEKLFQGYNVTILAYGQTGSGKTFTMGTSYSGSDGDSTKLGVIPQAVADIFDFIETHEDEYVFRVSVSFMELYQEQCYDLLSGKERSHSIIEIREDSKGVVLPGLSELLVTSTMETMTALERGCSSRVTGSTAMNQASSRSHAVFTIIIAKESRADKNLSTTSKFHLVDLAGSERIKKTNATGVRLREVVKINQGLLALGNVISALSDGSNRNFIVYRQSKLTRLLKDSLGGNSLTLMVACVSPADYNLDETVSTLRYADRAQCIHNKPIINQDIKAAEILRLNNLINELRFQMLELPKLREQKIEQLEEELEREKVKYAELLNNHKEVTKNLSNMLIENTNLYEKIVLADAAKDKFERKLNELTKQCNQTIENLSTTDKLVEDQAQKTCIIDYIKEITNRVNDLQLVNLKTNEELIDHEIKLSFVVEDEKDNVDDDVVLNEDQAVLEEQQRTMGQVALNQELQELNRTMVIKASTVQAILANKDMIESDNQLRENEEKMLNLEKERDELLQQLKHNKIKDASNEVQRSKVTSLKADISELKKKCQQQKACIIKTKKNNDAEIAALNAELQDMKATKVKLIRKMCEESEKFRKWKSLSERALRRLRNEDRKRATAMAKMEALHAKQQKLLKREMEQAVAVNKRLKEALDKQKQSQIKRNAKGSVIPGAVQQYILHEVEVKLSILEAKRSLEELMSYRTLITEQIESIKNGTDNESNRQKITELEDNLALRKAQISDLQQKILTSDQENKSNTQWDNIQSMLEAKVALKCLFELLVDAKRELQNQSEEGYRARYMEIKEAYDRLELEFDNSKTEFKRQLEIFKLQYEQKLSALVALQRGVVGSSYASNHLQNVINVKRERLEDLEAENKKLAEELEQMRIAGTSAKRRSKEETSVKEGKKTDYVELDDDFEDEDKDPDWGATPLSKRVQAHRSLLKMNFTSMKALDGSEEPTAAVAGAQTVKRGRDGLPYCFCRGSCSTQLCDCVKADKGSEEPTAAVAGAQTVKRGSDGLPYCVCRGSCSTKLCDCVKADKDCGTSCRCQRALCKNRRSFDGEDKENTSSCTELSLVSTPESYFKNKLMD